MTRSPWSMAIVGLAIGSLALAGGTVIGGEIGPLTAGYGVLIGLAALYAVIGLTIRDRAWRRLWRLRTSRVETVASHRVF